MRQRSTAINNWLEYFVRQPPPVEAALVANAGAALQVGQPFQTANRPVKRSVLVMLSR